MVESKTCTSCGIERELSEFAPKGNSGKLRSHCRPCINEQNLRRYYTNVSTREAHRRASRKHLLKKYGLTQESFEALHTEQKGSCAICAKPIELVSGDRHKSACIDHCHSTNVVRGLLCWDCNVGLGKFYDNTSVMEAAIAYLKKEHNLGFTVRHRSGWLP